MKATAATWLLSCIVAHGATYYVATNGNNANPGSSEAPWLTIQKAVDTISAGDGVLVRFGVYTNELLTSSKSGSEGLPITIEGENFPLLGAMLVRHTNIVIRGFSFRSISTAAYCLGFEWEAEDITVASNRFEDTGVSKSQIWMEHGDWGRRPTRISIANNHFLDSQYYALALQGSGHFVASNYFSAQYGGDAVYLHSCNTTIKANVFTNWSRPEESSAHTDLIQAFASNGEISTNNVIEGNLALNCVGTQIGNLENQGGRNPGVQDWIWRNNIWVNVEASMNMSAPGMKFYNNVFYKSGLNTGAPILFRSGAYTNYGHNGQVFNNVFVECGSNTENPILGWYSVDVGVTNFAADYNLVIGTGAGQTKTGFQTGSLEANGINGIDPQFVNPMQGDCTVTTESPVIGAGTDLSAFFTDDFTGSTRIAPWDIGAYEYLGRRATAGTVNVGTLTIAP